MPGGPSSRHSSSGAAERIFSRVFGLGPADEALTDWDGFHRDDRAFSRSVGANTAMMEATATKN